jgi:CRP-like cAMP-binding protein
MIEAPIPFDAIPMLAGLRKEDREALAPLCRVRGFEKGETIFREGDPADRIYFVHLGRVKIVKSAGGRDLIIEIVAPTRRTDTARSHPPRGAPRAAARAA